MDEPIWVETDVFNHTEVKPNFINDCCFGEDFAAWLRQELSPNTGPDFVLSEIIQEDYGWGFWVEIGKDPFWIAISYCPDGQWGVIIEYDPGLNVFKRLFHKPDPASHGKLKSIVIASLKNHPRMRIV